MILMLIFLLFMIVIIGLLILFLLKSKVAFRISFFADLDRLKLKIHFFFRNKELHTFEWDETSLVKLSNKYERIFSVFFNTRTDSDDWFFFARKMHRAFEKRHVANVVQVTDFVWITSIGTGEADQAAWLSGVIWSLKCMILPLISEWLDDPPPRIKVVPLFQERRLATRFSCMISFKAGEAIAMMRRIKRQMKEGEADGRASNPRFNENGAG
ncbi:hypothetical protein SPSP110954_12220 [Sporolactobacillus spathodeae]